MAKDAPWIVAEGAFSGCQCRRGEGDTSPSSGAATRHCGAHTCGLNCFLGGRGGLALARCIGQPCPMAIPASIPEAYQGFILTPGQSKLPGQHSPKLPVPHAGVHLEHPPPALAPISPLLQPPLEPLDSGSRGPSQSTQSNISTALCELGAPLIRPSPSPEPSPLGRTGSRIAVGASPPSPFPWDLPGPCSTQAGAAARALWVS